MTTADGSSPGVHPGSPPTKASLANWWERFKKKPTPKEDERPTGIFSVPLHKSIQYANVAISLTDTNGEQFIYGYVPIVVAKCGVFLKEKATDVEGIFRLSGSAKRIKDLQTIFNSPDKYGKGLDWTGYTVHDAANVLRRYLNQLPEPIIPLEFYSRFREPLATPPEGQEVLLAIRSYQRSQLVCSIFVAGRRLGPPSHLITMRLLSNNFILLSWIMLPIITAAAHNEPAQVLEARCGRGMKNPPQSLNLMGRSTPGPLRLRSSDFDE
jgi:hypothetical protein